MRDRFEPPAPHFGDIGVYLRRGRTKHGLVLAAVIAAVAGMAGTLAGKGSSARAAGFSYCADQTATFKDHHPFTGISDPFVQAGTQHYQECSFGRMAAAHVGFFRSGLSWAAIEVVPNQYDFSVYDQLMMELARHHLRFLPMLTQPPARLSTQPRDGPAGAYPPRVPRQFAAFAALCVRRYGPSGTFWRAHPELPYYPVRAWQVWNEPNLAQYWAPKPNARAYVALLRATSSAIRLVDRRALVVMAGMPFLSPGAATRYYTQLYGDGVRGSFDALAVHPYSASVQGAEARVQAARAVMNRFGDHRKGIWITEWGWAGGPPNPYIVNQAGQRANIGAFLAFMQRHRAQLGVRELIYFDWRDKVYGPGPSWWGYHLGLFTQGLRPKLALRAFTSAAQRLDR
jgi:hypothetical protein